MFSPLCTAHHIIFKWTPSSSLWGGVRLRLTLVHTRSSLTPGKSLTPGNVWRQSLSLLAQPRGSQYFLVSQLRAERAVLANKPGSQCAHLHGDKSRAGPPHWSCVTSSQYFPIIHGEGTLREQSRTQVSQEAFPGLKSLLDLVDFLTFHYWRKLVSGLIFPPQTS